MRNLIRSGIAVLPRLTAIAALIWVGWGTISTLATAFDTRSSPSRATAERHAASRSKELESSTLVLTSLDAGSWEFTGLPCRFVIEEHGNSDFLEAVITSTPGHGVELTKSDAELLIKVASYAGTQRELADGGKHIQFSKGELLIDVVLNERDSVTRFIAGGISLYYANEGLWRSYRVTPNNRPATKGDTLFPVNSEIRTIATRYSDENQPVLSIGLANLRAFSASVGSELGSVPVKNWIGRRQNELASVNYIRLGESMGAEGSALILAVVE